MDVGQQNEISPPHFEINNYSAAATYDLQKTSASIPVVCFRYSGLWFSTSTLEQATIAWNAMKKLFVDADRTDLRLVSI